MVDSGKREHVWYPMKTCNAMMVLLTLSLVLAGCSGTEQASSTVREGQDSASDASNLEGSDSRRSPVGVHSRPVADLSALICTGECADLGPLEASSEAEALWMVKHRYPSKQELQRLAAMSITQLQQEAAAGNSAAAVMLGKRIALERNFVEGQVILREQTLSGNMFAFYAISESFREAQDRNLVEGAAYLRLAYILGDRKAADEIAKMRLSSAEISAADTRALQLYPGFAEDQVPDPRPR